MSSVLLAITVCAAVVLSMWPSGYLVESPGNAIATDSLVRVPSKVETYAHPGDFLLVTVSETNQPVFGQAFVGWLDPTSDVFPRSQVVGDTPPAAELRFQAVLMEGAKLSAIYKAMGVLGYSATVSGGGVFVSRIVSDSPVDGKLAIGDTITAMNGKKISTVDDVTRFMNDAKPGDKVKITVDRLGVSQNKKVDVTLGETERDGEQAPFLGIYMETRPNYQFPFDVDFDTGEIGGPSAGLAMTLTLIDKLSAEGLTNGNDIAVTGTIKPDGSVGPIGGIHQKVAAVEDAGARYFVVPEANAKEARSAVDDALKIIPVTSLDDALAKVRDLPEGHAPR